MLEFCPTPGTFKYKKIIIFNLKAILYIPQTSYNNQMEKKPEKKPVKKVWKYQDIGKEENRFNRRY